MLDDEQDLPRVLRTVVNTPRKKAGSLQDSGPGSTFDGLAVLDSLELVDVGAMTSS